MSIDQQEYHRLSYEAATAEAAERIRFSVEFAQRGLQSLTLANGGALIALFTFVGNSGAIKLNVNALWWAFALFALGLASNLVAFIGAHLSQDEYYNMAQVQAWKAQAQMIDTVYSEDELKHHARGAKWQMLAMICALLALASFIAGAAFALAGVTPR